MPAKSLPVGAFAKILDILNGGKRIVLTERAGAEQQGHRPGPARHAVGDAG